MCFVQAKLPARIKEHPHLHGNGTFNVVGVLVKTLGLVARAVSEGFYHGNVTNSVAEPVRLIAFLGGFGMVRKKIAPFQYHVPNILK